LKVFRVVRNSRCAPRTIEALWPSQSLGWIKINTYGVSCGSLGHAFIGGIVRDHFSVMKCAFSFYIDIQTSLFDELVAAMKEIELAGEKDCSFIWLFIIVRLLVYV
jgi:hypothetical protein